MFETEPNSTEVETRATNDGLPRGGVRSESVRIANLSTILRCLHFSGPKSRSRLVEETGLTRSSVAALVGELSDAGLVSEHAATPSGSPGRPSPTVAVNADRNMVLAIKIEVDDIAVAIVGLGGEVLYRIRVNRYRDLATVEQTVNDIATLVADAHAAVGNAPLLGASVAIVGLVQRSTNTLVIAPNLGWSDIALGDLLQHATQLDIPFAVANEGDVAALAETRRGTAVGQRHVIFLSGEVGVGGGIVAGGRVISGRGGFAGEVGHMPVNPDGLECGCGARGCWETEVGVRSLLRRTGRKPEGGPAALDEVLQAAARGDADVLQALDTQGDWLGTGLAGLIHIFDPEMVVLGGMFRRVYPYVIEALQRSLTDRLLATTVGDIDIVASTLGEDASLLGAAELAFEPLLNDPLAFALR